jgi:sorbitol/mannitol transport system substrate-binding protein
MTHKNARKLVHIQLDIPHSPGKQHSLDPALQNHLERCPSCREYAERLIRLDVMLTEQLPDAVAMKKISRKEMDLAEKRVKEKLRRKEIMNILKNIPRQAFIAVALIAGVAGLIWAIDVTRPVEPAAPEATLLAPSGATPTIEPERINTPMPEPTPVQGVDQTGSDQVLIGYTDMGFFQSQYDGLIDEFETLHPDIRVEFLPVENAPGGFQQVASYADIIKRGLPVGDDIYNYLDLTPLLEADPNFDADGFWPGLLEGCSASGRLLGLPSAARVSTIAYDGVAFEAAGLPRPAPGWTWEDFAAAVEALTQREGGEITRYGFVDTGWPLLLLGPLADTVLNTSGGEPETMDLADALSWYVDLVQQGAVLSLPPESGAVTLEEMIQNNQVAMWIESTVLSQRTFSQGRDLGLAPYPLPSGVSGSGSNRATAECLMISAGTAHPQEAWEWIQFLTTRRVPSPLQAAAIPARRDVAEDSGYWDQLDETTEAAFRFGVENGWYGLISVEPLNAIGQALSQAIAGELNLDDALADALAELDQVASLPPPASTPAPVSPPSGRGARPTPPPGAVVVDYFVDTNWHTSLQAVQALADAFHQANPEIFVKLTDNRSAFNMGEGYNNITLAERFGCYSSSMFSQPENAGFIWYSLEPLIEADAEGAAILGEIPSAWFERDRHLLGEELFALPLAGRPVVMYYNKDLFAQMGLPLPALDWTMDDFWVLAEAAASSNTYGFVPLRSHGFLFGLDKTWELWDFANDPPQVTFEKPELLEALTFLAEMVDKRAISPITDYSPQNDYQANQTLRHRAVDRGAAAMWNNEAGFRYGTYTPPEGLPFEVGVAPMPTDLTPRPAGSRISFYISRKSEDPAACWEWGKFLSSHPSVFHGVPLRQSVLESPDTDAYFGPETAAVYRAVMAQPLAETVIRPDRYNSIPVFWWWNVTYSEILKGANPEQSLRELQRKSEVYLDCMIATDGQDFQECGRQADPDFVYPTFPSIP